MAPYAWSIISIFNRYSCPSSITLEETGLMFLTFSSVEKSIPLHRLALWHVFLPVQLQWDRRRMLLPLSLAPLARACSLDVRIVASYFSSGHWDPVSNFLCMKLLWSDVPRSTIFPCWYRGIIFSITAADVLGFGHYSTEHHKHCYLLELGSGS